MALHIDSEMVETCNGTLYADLWNLLKEDFETDTEIFSQTENKSLRAHRLILSARSSLICSLLESLKTQAQNSQNGITVSKDKICIEDVSFVVIKTLVTYMYTDKIPSLTILDYSNIVGGQIVFLMELLQIARRLEMVCLTRVTRNILLRNLACDKLSYTPSDLLVTVDHSLPRLSLKEISVRLAVLYRLACHLGDILQEHTLELVSLETLDLIFQIGISHNNDGCLSSENCQLTPLPELCYFLAALRWAHHNCAIQGTTINGPNLRKALGNLIQKIHFSRLNSVELADKIRQSDILTADEMVSYLSRSVLKFPPVDRKTAALHRKDLHNSIVMFQPVEFNSTNVQRDSYYCKALNLRFIKSTVLLTSFAVQWIYPKDVFLRIFQLPQEKCIFSTPCVLPQTVTDNDKIYHVFQVAVVLFVNKWYRIEVGGQMIHDNDDNQQPISVPSGNFDKNLSSSENTEFEVFLPNKNSSTMVNESSWFPATFVQYLPTDLLHSQESVHTENRYVETVFNSLTAINSQPVTSLSAPTMTSSQSTTVKICRSNNNSQYYEEFSPSSSSAQPKRSRFDFTILRNHEEKINNRISNLQTRVQNQKLQLMQTKLECKPIINHQDLINENCTTQETPVNALTIESNFSEEIKELPLLEQIGSKGTVNELQQTIDEANTASSDGLRLILTEPEPEMPLLKLEISDTQYLT